MLSIKALVIISSATWVSCTITGLSYMDPLNFKPLKSPLPEQDACNPLYWYPKSIPEYCNFKLNPKPKEKPVPVPMPIPLPSQPFPIPIPMGPIPSMLPILPPYPMSPGYTVPAPPMPMSPLPMPIYPPMPLPYGIPIAPTNPMLPVAGLPTMVYPSPFPQYRPRYQAGLVPGIPGIVTHDGGINILPFSDAYADLLEKHKQKMIRKKIQRIFDDYDSNPSRRERSRRRHRQ